ncbi:MAG TPA: antitoxin [Verrucomicrobiota bacterium]|nr:antitoxin [Verrucomicrobiota bacterium]HNU50328.1 antitoxin [Verrucomicrobiota bacterium]
MRTTVTLDKDVERLLREAMHNSRAGFKQTLNAALRRGLGGAPPRPRRRPFVIRAQPLGLRAGLDPARLNSLADDLDIDAFLGRHRARPAP